MGPRPSFFVFGIPVTVDPWFFVGLFFFYSLSGGGRVGAFTAASIGVFTLIHELGHAVTARRFGADGIHITLNMFIGWASYSARTPLARWQRNLISLMGPMTQVIVAVTTLRVLRAVMLPIGESLEDVRLYIDLHGAIVWGGIVIAGLNLLPLWPLDGGHIAESIVGSRFGIRGRRLFLQWTLAVSAVMVVGGALSRGDGDNAVRRFAAAMIDASSFDALPVAVGKVLAAVPALAVTSAGFIAIFTGFSTWQALQHLRLVHDPLEHQQIDRKALAQEPALRQVRTAERHGWTLGQPGEYPRSWGPSPWLEAHLARPRGAPGTELTRLLRRLAQPKRNWLVDDLSRPALGELLAFVPPEVSTSAAVVEARVFHGPPDDLVAAALAAHRDGDEAEAFYLIAEGMAQRGLHDDAMSWLTGAVERHPDPRRVATSRHLSVLHGRSDFQQLLGVAERAVAPSPRSR